MLRLGPETDLGGTWLMQPERVELNEPKGGAWCEVTLPMPWSAFLAPSSGVPPDMVPNHMAWFRRKLTIPDVPPFSRLVLHFEAVNFFAMVFVDGKRCGQHAGDAIPFEIDLTDFVTLGREAELMVGVQDVSYAEFEGDELGRRGAARKLIYLGLPHHSGIWGGVSLRVVPELHIAGVAVKTVLSDYTGIEFDGGHIRVRVAVENRTNRQVAFSLTNEVYDGARQVVAFAPVRGAVGPGEVAEMDMGTSWDSASLWWPDAPHLYTLRTALWSSSSGTGSEAAGDVVDRVYTGIGFREFRIDGETFTLNNVPVQLRSESVCPISGQLFGSMLSGGAVVPANHEQARDAFSDLKKHKGLNAVRFHRMPPSRVLLDAADEAGLMAIVEFPLPDDERRYAVDDPKFWVNAQALIWQWVAARLHHPSIVMWSLDQGMVRRYGRRAVGGLRSLARFVADTDPTRPVENGGDANLVNAGELTVRSPVSVFFPATGVALRAADAYEPDDVRGRLLPVSARPGEWLPKRPPGQPLCILEHTRRRLTADSLAFFLGDGAYAAGADLAEAAASLAQLEMASCRLAGFAAVNTIGRPAAKTPGTADTAGEIVALPSRLFANFYAGTQIVENLVIRNDTRFAQDFEIVSHLTTADGKMSECGAEMLIAAGSRREQLASFDLPDILKVYDAANAAPIPAELAVDVTGSRAGSFKYRREIAIWPHVRATRDRRIGLYDPDGRTASALSAVGAKHTAAHGAPDGEFDTIVIGENAFETGSVPDAASLRSFVAAGGLAICLAQREMPYDLSPVTMILDEKRAASITFVRDAEHSVLHGLSDTEMRWWQDNHCVAARCFRKPSSGNFRCLIDAGGPGGLRWAAALEVFHGRGSYVFSQIELVDRAARTPVAGLLLARLADAMPSWQAAEVRTLEDEETFERIGVRCAALSAQFGADELGEIQCVLFTAENVRGCSPPQLRLLREWTQRGGCLYVHDLQPDDEKLIAALTGEEVRIISSTEERLVFRRPGYGLARGLSSADLSFLNHGAKYSGGTWRRLYAATGLVRARGNAAGVASSVESDIDYGLLTFQMGRGHVVVDQVRWDIETRSDSRSGRYISTLLTNLGVALTARPDTVSSDKCRLVDISAACNSNFIDPMPGEPSLHEARPTDGGQASADGSAAPRSFSKGGRMGWTGRGPDNDMSTFSPGLLFAAGVPFRVGGAGGHEVGDCCVLGPGIDPADGEQSRIEAPPIKLGCRAQSLAFLVACEGRARPCVPVAHFTVRYDDGLETQVALRYGIDVVDWNELPRDIDGAAAAWKGSTAVGEPASIYAKRWEINRPDVPVERVVFSTTRSGVTPVLLAITAIQ